MQSIHLARQYFADNEALRSSLAKAGSPHSMKDFFFILSTLCALPCAGSLVVYVMSFLPNCKRLIDYVVIAGMFGWPLFLGVAVTGLVSLCISWRESSRRRKIILSFCALSMAGFLSLEFYAMLSLGPL